MKSKLTFLLFSVLLSYSITAQNTTLSGVSFPKKLKFGEETLDFNGMGLRTKYFFKLYVAGLYLPTPTSDEKGIINRDELSALRIRIISNQVTRDKFIESIEEGFARTSEGRATQAQKDKLKELFSDSFKDGDDIILAFKPSIGVQIYMNSKSLGTVGDLEFKKALWGIWLGNNPADAALKNALLGK